MENININVTKQARTEHCQAQISCSYLLTSWGLAKLIMLTLSGITHVLTRLAPVEKNHVWVVGWLDQVKIRLTQLLTGLKF